MSEGKNVEPSVKQSQTRGPIEQNAKAPEEQVPAEDVVDDFGLPKRPVSRPLPVESDTESDSFHDAHDSNDHLPSTRISPQKERLSNDQRGTSEDKDPIEPVSAVADIPQRHGSDERHRSQETTPPGADEVQAKQNNVKEGVKDIRKKDVGIAGRNEAQEIDKETVKTLHGRPSEAHAVSDTTEGENTEAVASKSLTPPISPTAHKTVMDSPIMKRARTISQPVVSEWSHQKLASRPEQKQEEEEEEVQWQPMKALDEFDIHDDNGRLIAKGVKEDDSDDDPYSNIGGAGKGYSRVLLDDDADSQNSFDEETNYLFKGSKAKPADSDDEFDDGEEDPRDMLQQLDATKDLLTEGQRIAYVGIVRLIIYKMQKALEDMERTRATKKETVKALESMEIWGQQMMVRLYGHMDIDTAEQIMIEQLAEHGVEPADLSPTLMQNARVKNPLADGETSRELPKDDQSSTPDTNGDEKELKDVKEGQEVPEVHGVKDAPKGDQIDLDIRWTVLCDLFLVLVADSNYDSRSRRLLERVASIMEITWVQICRFEKRVVDQLEMEEAAKENWNEKDHMENRRKKALKRKYVLMGLATVGGGLVIGLSAGLLAPLIGAGLAGGFSAIGVAGTAGFLGSTAAAAIITSAATAAGGTIAVRATHRRTGHVRIFEYRPLHNNKRLNLILTVSGWMTGKVDDVRLPFSTVDPIMGDIYSLLWEPDMLRSMGDTINILATEALTQSIQQVLGSTILTVLMASLQVPIILTKLSYLIDNPWSVSLDRAAAAGLILADSLIARHLGQRPITLVGFSLGARVIFFCLKELSNRGAYGIVQNVYLFGSPIVAKKDEYLRARSVISGRFVNGYASNDWILGYLFRATAGGIMQVAGLAPIEGVPGLENLDVTELVNGHMAYRAAMPKLLRKLKWEVESDEFTEIEDPDPDNHEKRQRELIAEIDEARKKAEEKPEKRRFGFWKRGKMAEKKTWETYDPKAAGGHKKNASTDEKDTDANMWGENKVLFDIDAIRRELAGEQIDVRELKSTQPPIQVSTIKNGEQVTEYLRLPPGITPEEMKKMKLSPRTDEIEGSPLPSSVKSLNGGIQRTNSSPAPGTITPNRSGKNTPNLVPSPTPPPAYNNGDDLAFVPKEIKSTLPPLQLSPGLPMDNATRPELKSHTTTPLPERSSWDPNDKQEGTYSADIGLDVGAGAGAGAGLAVEATAIPPPLDVSDLEHNAWDDYGGDDSEIKMTFA